MILSGWKQIAGHLDRGVRTVQRWERLFALPVQRPARRGRTAVLAIAEEIDRWAHSRWNGIPPEARTHLSAPPSLRIQETFSETRKLLVELRGQRAKQQHLLGPLRQESRRHVRNGLRFNLNQISPPEMRMSGPSSQTARKSTLA